MCTLCVLQVSISISCRLSHAKTLFDNVEAFAGRRNDRMRKNLGNQFEWTEIQTTILSMLCFAYAPSPLPLPLPSPSLHPAAWIFTSGFYKWFCRVNLIHQICWESESFAFRFNGTSDDNSFNRFHMMGAPNIAAPCYSWHCCTFCFVFFDWKLNNNIHTNTISFCLSLNTCACLLFSRSLTHSLACSHFFSVVFFCIFWILLPMKKAYRSKNKMLRTKPVLAWIAARDNFKLKKQFLF